MRAGVALLLVLLVASAPAQAQDGAPADRREAEQRLQQVRSELKAVASERRKLEGARGDASRQLRQADEQVGSVQRSLRGIESTLQRDTATLAQLQAERATLSQDMDARKAELARLLRAAQVAGDDAPLKAMLAQDRIADAERALTYQGYLQRGRVQRIRELGAELQRIDALEHEIGERQAALSRDRQQRAAQLAQLEAARKQRVGLLAGIDKQYQDRASREKALGRDARALQGLLAQLRAAAAKAAREAARVKEEAAKRSASGTKAPPPKRTAVASVPALRVGGLGWPVSGSLLAPYGGQLPDGRRSDGVLIAANAGTAVKAVADGTVVFADWMTGYGNILIIDHGNGYMSLYAHNDGLLRDAGDAVKRGDPVASVGTSGGQTRPALYFELRRNGTPVNPGSWSSRE
jgi:septal ring factor EnvC (AmiA/AmiB activator)